VTGPPAEGGSEGRNNRTWLIWPVLLVAVVDLFAVWFVSAEHTLYHADQVTYWSYSRSLAEGMVSQPLAAFFAVARSVAELDVNLLPAAPVAGALVVLGGSRLAYVVSVISLYGLAALLSSIFALRRLSRGLENERSLAASWAALLTILLFATIWRPIFIGYLGIGGVAIGSAALGLYLADSLRPARSSARTLVLVGVLAALMIVFRRWYAFWSLALWVTVATDAVSTFLSSREWSRGALWEAMRAPIVIGASAAAALLMLSPSLTLQRLQTDYSDRFSAYGLDQSLMERVGSVVDEFGVALLLVVIGCSALLLIDRVTRRVAVLLLVQLMTTYLAMVSVQDHSPQHWYLYYPAAMLLVGLGLMRITVVVGDRRWSRAAVAYVVGIAIVTTAAVYLPAAGAAADWLGPLVPATRLRPKVRDDLPEVDRLLRFLDRRLQPEPGFIYVLASSETLSEQVLAFANLSLGTHYRSTRTILQSAHVDRRDGFPAGLLEASTVLVAEPIQFHLDPLDQQVVGIPATSLLDGENIGLAFQRLAPVFSLRDGVTVHVFARTRAPSEEEVEVLSGLLAAAYPDRPDVYLP